MDENSILKMYAIFYIAENDDFNFAKKIDMLNFIESANDSMVMELYESGEILTPDILDELYLAPGLSLAQLKATINNVKKAKETLQHQYDAAKGAVKNAIKKRIDNANSKIDAIQDKITGHSAPKRGLEKAVEGGKEILQTAKDKVAGAAGKAAEYAQSHPGAAAAAAVGAAAAITAGVMAYRRFVSKAGRACAGAPDKKACRKEYFNKGIHAQIAALNAGKEKCFKTGNTDKCKAKIDVKISKVKNKLKEVK